MEAFMKGLQRGKRKKKKTKDAMKLRLKRLRARKEQLAKDSAADEKTQEIHLSPREIPRSKEEPVTSLPFLGQIMEVGARAFVNDDALSPIHRVGDDCIRSRISTTLHL